MNCRFEENGCEINLVKLELNIHEKDCQYRRISCVYPRCCERMPLKNLLGHVDEKHYLDVFKTDQSHFSGKFKMTKSIFDKTQENLIYLKLNVDSMEKEFYSVFARFQKMLYWTVYYLGQQCDAEKYISSLTIFNTGSGKVLMK